MIRRLYDWCVPDKALRSVPAQEFFFLGARALIDPPPGAYLLRIESWEP